MFNVVQRLLHKKSPQSAAEVCEYTMPEAGLNFTKENGLVTVTCLYHTEPLFSVVGVPFSQPNSVRTRRQDMAAVVLNMGEQLSIVCVPVNFGHPGETATLKRAVSETLPDGRRVLEFIFYSGSSRLHYTAEIAAGVLVENFHTYTPSDSLFVVVPPVSQMVAFLRATLHQRRTVLRSLHGMARRAGNSQIQEVVGYMLEKFSINDDFMQPVLLELRDSLESFGKVVYLNSLEAMCLLADIFLGNITKDLVDKSIQSHTILPISQDACTATALYLGGEPTHPGSERVDEAVEYLRSTVANRSIRTILQDLAEDGGSSRSSSAISKMLEIVPENQSLVNDQHVALREYLAVYGKTIKPETATAVCLYVDFEAGVINERHIATLSPDVCLGDHSLYALLAVGSAFGVDIRCLCLTADSSEEVWQDLASLTALSGRGVIARFVDPDAQGTLTYFVPSIKRLDEIRRSGVHFTGDVLLQIPVIDYIDSRDFGLFLKKNIPILSCFLSDDRVIRWGFANHMDLDDPDRLPESLVGRYGFIEGFRSFRFYNKVVGRYVSCKAESLLGRTSVVAVFVNHRGSRSYKYVEKVNTVEDVTKPPNSELTFADEVVEFPRLPAFSSKMCEPSHEYSLGLEDRYTNDNVLLVMCYNGLRVSLLGEPSMVSLRSDVNTLDALREAVNSLGLRSALMETLDYSTRRILVALLGKKGSTLRGDILVTSTLAGALNSQSLRNTAALCVLYSMCADADKQFERYNLKWRPVQFRDMIQQRLYQAVQSDSINTRVLACALLANRISGSFPEHRDGAVSVLNRLLDDHLVGLAASMSLARLSLLPTVNVAVLVQFSGWENVNVTEAAETEALREVVEVLNDWMHQPASIITKAEIPARANLRGETEKLEILGHCINTFNLALQQERNKTLSRSYAVLPPGRADEFRRMMLLSWNSYLGVNNLPTSGKRYGAHVYDEYMRGLNDYEANANRTVLWHNPECYNVSGWYQMQPGNDPFFLKLAALTPPQSVDISSHNSQPSICRFMPSAIVDNKLDMGRVEVLSVQQGRWLPFMHVRFVMSLSLGQSDRRLYDTLGDLYETLRGSEPDLPETVPAFSHKDQEADSVSKDDYGYESLNELADHVASCFGLPPASWKLVLTMLLGIKKDARYSLPPFRE